MADGRHVGKYCKCYSTFTDGPTAGQNLGGRIQRTHLPQNRFLGIGRYANRTVNVLVLWGVEIKISTILMNLNDCATVLRIKKLISGRRTANINTTKP